MPNALTVIPEGWEDPIFSAAEAANLLAQPYHVLLALQGGQGGHLLARAMPHTPADVLTLYVPESCRKQGHAKKLMQAFIAYAQSQKCSALTLEVRQENLAAIGLYKGLGLSQIAQRPQYYRPSVSSPSGTALVFSLHLA